MTEKDKRIAELERAAVAHVRQVDNMQATIDEMLASDLGKMSERIAELEKENKELGATISRLWLYVE